ncbi:MAG: 2,3-bisphosphoglycerate-independent phosphoglycerate mutase [Deltaproteobacteria bacterium]|nr:2,3-bisphosphoglycerate-independent phosphoglycerate mutase [Deltaproteobacteria bacterium]
MSLELKRSGVFGGCKGPVVIAVLDGVGIGAGDEADAVKLARTPTLDSLWVPGKRASLQAHGTAVGLPDDGDMGNSEVGHNALGSGQVVDQGAKLVNRAIAEGTLFEGEHWQALMKRAQDGRAVHFIGLLSDGNVHSHIDHLEALLGRAGKAGAKRLVVHPLLDGRDVPATSALEYVDALETILASLREAGVEAVVGSGGGRMTTTMDRYQADWSMVQRGWEVHVHGKGRQFSSLRKAVETLRDEQPGIGDQNLPSFVIAKDGQPVGRIASGDGVVFFNFRGDRGIEISRAFEDDDLTELDRGDRPDVYYCGMMEYDGDLHVPKRYLVEPPSIERTMGEYLARAGVRQLAISETQKYGHVTYFWNGNRSGAFDDALETYVEIPSDTVPFEQRPWMKAAEITDRLIAELRQGNYGLARVNYANGDMVGHTGHLGATIMAVEAVDLQLARLRQVVDELGGILVVTADHGNADEMYFHNKKGQVVRDDSGVPKVRTSHSLSPVPFVIHDSTTAERYQIDPEASKQAGIANVAAVGYQLLGFEPPEGIRPSFLTFK